jgi:hypothetical protein
MTSREGCASLARTLRRQENDPRRYPGTFVKVLFIHGCHSPASSHSHQGTDSVPSGLSLILPSSSSSY